MSERACVEGQEARFGSGATAEQQQSENERRQQPLQEQNHALVPSERAARVGEDACEIVPRAEANASGSGRVGEQEEAKVQQGASENENNSEERVQRVVPGRRVERSEPSTQPRTMDVDDRPSRAEDGPAEADSRRYSSDIGCREEARANIGAHGGDTARESLSEAQGSSNERQTHGAEGDQVRERVRVNEDTIEKPRIREQYQEDSVPVNTGASTAAVGGESACESGGGADGSAVGAQVELMGEAEDIESGRGLQPVELDEILQPQRVKLYMLSDTGPQWDDRGTGYASIIQMTELVPSTRKVVVTLALRVVSEINNELMVFSRLRAFHDSFYQLQGPTILSWTEHNEDDPNAQSFEMALSFADADGCREVWDQIRRAEELMKCGPSGGGAAGAAESHPSQNQIHGHPQQQAAAHPRGGIEAESIHGATACHDQQQQLEHHHRIQHHGAATTCVSLGGEQVHPNQHHQQSHGQTATHAHVHHLHFGVDLEHDGMVGVHGAAWTEDDVAEFAPYVRQAAVSTGTGGSMLNNSAAELMITGADSTVVVGTVPSDLEASLIPAAAGGAVAVALPNVERRNLDMICAMLCDASMPLVLREKPHEMSADVLAAEICNGRFVDAMIELFRQCEADLDAEGLVLCFRSFRAMFMLGSSKIIQLLLDEDHAMGVMGALEYDPEFYRVEKNNNAGAGAGVGTASVVERHRTFLREKVKFKQVVEIESKAVIAKIHQNYRAVYVKDVVLPRVMDDGTFTALSTVLFYNNMDIVLHFVNEPSALNALFKSLHETVTLLCECSRDDEPERYGSILDKYLDLLRFLLELCNLSKPLQQNARVQFQLSVDSLGFYDVCFRSISHTDARVQTVGIELFSSAVLYDANTVRETLSSPTSIGADLLTVLMDKLTGHSDPGVVYSVIDILRMLLEVDPVAISPPPPLPPLPPPPPGVVAIADANERDNALPPHHVGENAAGSSVSPDGNGGGGGFGGSENDKAMVLGANGEDHHQQQQHHQQNATMALSSAGSGAGGGKKDFIAMFYDQYGHRMLATLNLEAGAGAEKNGSNNNNNEVEALDSCVDVTRSQVCDLLCFCVLHHTYRAKCFVLRHDVLRTAMSLLQHHAVHIKLCALRLFRACVSLKDEFYLRYSLRNDLLRPIAQLFEQNCGKNSLLVSAVLDLLDLVRREKIVPLAKEIVEKHCAAFDTSASHALFVELAQLRLECPPVLAPTQPQRAGENGRGSAGAGVELVPVAIGIEGRAENHYRHQREDENGDHDATANALDDAMDVQQEPEIPALILDSAAMGVEMPISPVASPPVEFGAELVHARTDGDANAAASEALDDHGKDNRAKKRASGDGGGGDDGVVEHGEVELGGGAPRVVVTCGGGAEKADESSSGEDEGCDESRESKRARVDSDDGGGDGGGGVNGENAAAPAVRNGRHRAGSAMSLRWERGELTCTDPNGVTVPKHDEDGDSCRAADADDTIVSDDSGVVAMRDDDSRAMKSTAGAGDHEQSSSSHQDAPARAGNNIPASSFQRAAAHPMDATHACSQQQQQPSWSRDRDRTPQKQQQFSQQTSQLQQQQQHSTSQALSPTPLALPQQTQQQQHQQQQQQQFVQVAAAAAAASQQQRHCESPEPIVTEAP